MDIQLIRKNRTSGQVEILFLKKHGSNKIKKTFPEVRDVLPPRPMLKRGCCIFSRISVSDPHKDMPPGSGSAWTDADPDPRGKKP